MRKSLLTLFTAMFLFAIAVTTACVDEPAASKATQALCTEDDPGCATGWVVGESRACSSLATTYGVESIGCGTQPLSRGFVSGCWASIGNFTAICDVDWDLDARGHIVVTSVRCYTF